MKILNSTRWDTKDIEKLFKRIVREVDRVEKPCMPFRRRAKFYVLTIENRHNGFAMNGHARLGGYSMYLKLGTEKSKGLNEMDFETKQKLARMIIHEYWHNLGYTLQDKNNYKCDTSDNCNVDYIKEYPIRLKSIMKEPKIDIKLQRYQRAIQNLTKAETRYKRAKTLFQKWSKQVNRYQKTYNYGNKGLIEQIQEGDSAGRLDKHGNIIY